MRRTGTRPSALAVAALLPVLGVDAARAGQDPTRDAPGPDALEARIESMRVEDHVWREIEWRTCLLEGIAASRESGKPILLWVFIHNPNTERC